MVVYSYGSIHIPVDYRWNLDKLDQFQRAVLWCQL